MSRSAPVARMSYAQYRAAEQGSAIRHEFLNVSQLEPHIEVYRRNERGLFELIEAGRGQRAPLASLGIEVDVDAVYADPLA